MHHKQIAYNKSYAARQKARGLILCRVWVPRDLSAQLIEFSEELRRLYFQSPEGAKLHHECSKDVKAGRLYPDDLLEKLHERKP